MNIDKSLIKTISNATKEMGEAVDKMAKGINTTLQKFRADVSQKIIDQFIIYNGQLPHSKLWGLERQDSD